MVMRYIGFFHVLDDYGLSYDDTASHIEGVQKTSSLKRDIATAREQAVSNGFRDANTGFYVAREAEHVRIWRAK